MPRVSNLSVQGWKNPFKAPTSVSGSCGKEKTSKMQLPGFVRLLVVDCLPASELEFSLNCSKNVEKLLETHEEEGVAGSEDSLTPSCPFSFHG